MWFKPCGVGNIGGLEINPKFSLKPAEDDDNEEEDDDTDVLLLFSGLLLQSLQMVETKQRDMAQRYG